MYNYRHYIYIELCKDSKAVVYNNICSVEINMTLKTGKLEKLKWYIPKTTADRKIKLLPTEDNR